MDSGDLPLDEDDDVIPQAAADMGTGTLVIVYTVIFKNIQFSFFSDYFYIAKYQYTEILSYMVFYKKNFILNGKKMTDANE